MITEELSEKVKQCSICKLNKNLEEFPPGLVRCYPCNRTYINNYKKQRRKTNLPLNEGTRTCRICNEVKSIKHFPIDATYKDGRATLCNKCKKDKIKKMGNYYISKRVGYANHCSRSKTRFKNNGGDKLTTAGIESGLEKQNGQCKYCGIFLDDNNLSLDHQIPLSRQGKNLDVNIACTCVDCNFLKHERTDEEFQIFIKRYINRVAAYQLETEGSDLKVEPSTESTS